MIDVRRIHSVLRQKSVLPRPLSCFFLIVALSLFVAAGCAHYPVNAPLAHYDPNYGYEPKNMHQLKESAELMVLLAFSGGGTRAAAFSYGVLEALRDTSATIDGRKTPLLDEVDAISSVSGGSFTAAYYGLFGDRIFEDFQEKFLNKNIEGALLMRTFFNPYNWVRLWSPWFGRSDLAAEYYDKYVFDGANFSDMLKQKGTMVFLNATEIVHGTRVVFTQDVFDMICSDLAGFSVARACAASSAVPILLTPILVKNYAGSCDYHLPKLLEEALETRSLPSRQFNLANNIRPFLDSTKTPYLHLVDGGVADNLGLRVLLTRIGAQGNAWNALKHSDKPNAHKIAIILVNAQTENNPKWSLLGPLSFGDMVAAYSSVAIARYNQDTIMLVRDSFDQWADDIRRGRCPEGQISTEPGSCGDIQFYLIDVEFDALKNAADRAYFKQLPTSFHLEPEQVDRLREAAKQILHNSGDFKKLLTDLQ